MRIRDAKLMKDRALPATNETVVSESIELLGQTGEDFLANAELAVSVPSLSVAQLANGAKINTIVEHSDDDSSFEELAKGTEQTGADGTGADAVNVRVGIPSDVKRFVRLSVTADTDLDASAVSAVFGVAV